MQAGFIRFIQSSHGSAQCHMDAIYDANCLTTLKLKLPIYVCCISHFSLQQRGGLPPFDLMHITTLRPNYSDVISLSFFQALTNKQFRVI